MTKTSTKRPVARVISHGGYYAVVTQVPGSFQWLIRASRFRSFDTAQKSADRFNAKVQS